MGLEGHVLRDPEHVNIHAFEDPGERGGDELSPEIRHLHDKVRGLDHHHAQALKADPFAKLPERPVNMHPQHIVALGQLLAAGLEVLRKTPGRVNLIAPLDVFPFLAILDRELVPLAGDEILG